MLKSYYLDASQHYNAIRLISDIRPRPLGMECLIKSCHNFASFWWKYWQYSLPSTRFV